jgi:hypothetical protein
MRKAGRNAWKNLVAAFMDSRVLHDESHLSSLYYKPRNILKLFMIFRYNSFTYRLTEPCLCGYMAAMQQAQLSSVAHTLILWISNCRAVVQRDDIQLNCHFACVRKGCLFAHRALVAAKPR